MIFDHLNNLQQQPCELILILFNILLCDTPESYKI